MKRPNVRLAASALAAGVALWGLAMLVRAPALAQIPTADDPITPPARLAIYYGYPSLVNDAGYNLEAATASFAEFDLVVLGDGLEHPSHEDHTNTQTIINNLNVSGAQVFGYVDLGATQDLSITTIYTYVDEWAAMGVAGIFFDEAGEDFGVTRTRLTDAMSYVHSLTLTVFVNAWHPKDVCGDDPPGIPSPLEPGDWCLAESHPVSDGRCSDLDLWWIKSQVIVSHCVPIGVNVATISTGDDGSAGWANHPTFQQSLWATYLFGFDALGFTNPCYSACITGADRLRPLPPAGLDVGDNFIGSPTGPSGSPPTYSRVTDNGTIYVWGDSSTCGGAFFLSPDVYLPLVGRDFRAAEHSANGHIHGKVLLQRSRKRQRAHGGGVSAHRGGGLALLLSVGLVADD